MQLLKEEWSFAKVFERNVKKSDHSGASFGCRDWKQCRSDDVSDCKGLFVIKRAKTFKKAFRINLATKKRDGSTVFMHSGIAYFISITLNKNAHRPIAYNTVIIVINILYKLKDMC